jgi:hypothetical protein
MKELDHEIEDVEKRLAHRRQVLDATAHEALRVTKVKAKSTLSSPAVLIGAVALGFLAGGGLGGRSKSHYKERRKQETQAAKKTGIAGVLMTGAMWLIKSQLGNPAAIAQLILSRLKKGDAASGGQSPRGDVYRPQFGQGSRPAQRFR